MDDVLKYLNEHKDWDVQAIGRFEYSEDLRFREVMAQGIERDIKANFPGVPAQDVCLLIGSHGLPTWLTDKGDPAIRQMRRTVDWLKTRLAKYPLYHGFLNDDFFPGAKWVGPDAATVAKKMHGDACPNVLLDGRLSFTTHHRATLYDLNYVARNILEEPDLGTAGTPHPLWVKPKVVLAPNFDGDEGYANLMTDLAKEAFARKGDIVVLKEFGKAPLANGAISTPGRFAEEFKRFTWPN
jgi:protoheme ferro-lyase